jgi:small subunit ribosomal protein S2
MRKQPDAVFIIDLKKEALAVREARRLNLPVIALVDTNCDPDEADYVVPGNDDAIRACALITKVLANAIAEGQQKVSAKDFQRKQQENGSAAAAAAESEAVAPETVETPAPVAEQAPAPAAEQAPPATAEEQAPAEQAPEVEQ